MKIAVALILFGAALCARADVIIYKVLQTNIWTGGGVKFKQVISGRMALDVDTRSITSFSWLPNTRFQVDCPQTTIGHIRAPLNVAQSAWSLQGAAYNESNQVGIVQYYLRGNDTSFLGDLVSPLSYRAPKLLRGTYRASYQAADGSVFVGEGNVVVTYLQGATFNANLNNQTAGQFIESLRQTWLGKGWVEVTPDAPCM